MGGQAWPSLTLIGNLKASRKWHVLRASLANLENTTGTVRREQSEGKDRLSGVAFRCMMEAGSLERIKNGGIQRRGRIAGRM